MPAVILARLFKTLRDNVRCVVLNACYSATQGAALAEEVGCIVGTSRSITDEAAILFASGFYGGLGYGRSVQTAFELGLREIEIDLVGLGEEAIPQLLVKDGVDPTKIYFAL